jgi:ATPase subunit of ABC transporter with duplicated ATPase domains
MSDAFLAYQGAFAVVSHDERFLAGIKVDRWLELSAGRLAETGPPSAG